MPEAQRDGLLTFANRDQDPREPRSQGAVSRWRIRARGSWVSRRRGACSA